MSPAEERAAKVNRGPAAGPENRRALIAAARTVFAEDGLGAPFSAVAKRAGVGQGSLYRHFPDRTALAAAVFEENLELLESYSLPPERGLDDLFDGVVDQALVSTALIDLMIANRDDARVRRLGERYEAVVDRLLERERAAGHVGAHVDTADVLLATGMLATEISRSLPELRADVARRGRAIFRAAFAPR